MSSTPNQRPKLRVVAERRKEPAFNLRLGDLKPQLEAEAKRNKRSLNQEIVYRLWVSLQGYSR